MALLIDLKLRFIKLYRTILYLPAVTSLVAIGIVWVWLFDPQYGLINQLLRGIGLEGPLWLAEPDMALIALVITAAWRNVDISPPSFSPACKASTYSTTRPPASTARALGHCFWSSRCLCCAPTVLFVVVMSVILSFQVFALVYVMTGRRASRLDISHRLLSLPAGLHVFPHGLRQRRRLRAVRHHLRPDDLLQFKFFGKQVEA